MEEIEKIMLDALIENKPIIIFDSVSEIVDSTILDKILNNGEVK